VTDSQPDWAPPGTDTGQANAARLCDYWLGGRQNFPADQEAGRALRAGDRAGLRAGQQQSRSGGAAGVAFGACFLG
jgi:S-adenosyl methyltransferase